MKTSKTLIACLIAGMTVLAAGGLTSCEKDEPTPVIVDNPLDAEVYYITGQVTDGSKGLDGVQISTTDATATSASDGTFQLAVKKKGIYMITLSKAGYITVSTQEEIPSNMEKSSSVSFFHEMTALNQAVTVRPDRDTVIVEKRIAVASLFIPAGALTKETDITITDFKMRLKGTIVLSMLNCIPDGLTFEKPVKVSVKNAASSVIYFADVIHFVEKNGKWQQGGLASFDASKNVYQMELDGFSNHSFRVLSTEVAGGSTSTASTSIVVDNLGQMEAKEQLVTTAQKIGWEISGDLSKSLQQQFVGLSQSDADLLSAQLELAIASGRGTASGSKEIPLLLGTAKVSGDKKVTVDVAPQTRLSTITFNLNYRGNVSPFTVVVTDYTGVFTRITNQYGESYKDHSGGSGS